MSVSLSKLSRRSSLLVSSGFMVRKTSANMRISCLNSCSLSGLGAKRARSYRVRNATTSELSSRTLSETS